MGNLSFTKRYTQVETEESLYFLPLLNGESVENEIIYVDTEVGQDIIHCLNEGICTVPEITDILFNTYDTEKGQISEDVSEFLINLEKTGIIINE